jgi:hypothetical protein
MTTFVSSADFKALKKAVYTITNPDTVTFPATNGASQILNLFVRYDSLQELSHGRTQALGIQIDRGEWGKAYTTYKAIFDCNVVVRTVETKKPDAQVSYVILSRLSLIKREEYSSWDKASKNLDKIIRSSRRTQEIGTILTFTSFLKK